MHTVPRMPMAADETCTTAPSNISTPDRYGQPACQHDLVGGEVYPPRTHVEMRHVHMHARTAAYL